MSKKPKYTHGFKTPEGYFDQFEDRLFDQLELNELPKNTGFIVPDAYFEEFETSLDQRIAAEKNIKVLPLYKRKSFWYAASVAACLALIVTFYPANPTIGSQDLQLSEIENYIESDGLDLNTYEIASLLNEEEIEELSSESEYFSEENLENYLLENLEDTSLLIELQ